MRFISRVNLYANSYIVTAHGGVIVFTLAQYSQLISWLHWRTIGLSSKWNMHCFQRGWKRDGRQHEMKDKNIGKCVLNSPAHSFDSLCLSMLDRYCEACFFFMPRCMLIFWCKQCLSLCWLQWMIFAELHSTLMTEAQLQSTTNPLK